MEQQHNLYPSLSDRAYFIEHSVPLPMAQELAIVTDKIIEGQLSNPPLRNPVWATRLAMKHLVDIGNPLFDAARPSAKPTGDIQGF